MEIIYEPFKNLPLSEFHDELRFEFPDLPAQLFDYYLVRTAIFMAKQGNLIRRSAIISAQHGVTRYRLEAPDGMEICAVLDIRSMPDCSCMQRVVTRAFAPPEGSYSCGKEIAWFDDQEKVLHVQPPYCHGVYYVMLAVTPVMGACELPEKFLTEFLSTLLMGTKGSILLISGRPWTNMQLGQAYYNEFVKLISKESIDVATHKMRGGIKMQFGKVL